MGFSLQVIGFGADSRRDRDRLSAALRDDNVEAVCAIGPCLENFRSLIASVPLITVCTFHPTEPPWIGGNVEGLTHEVISYLISKGHRRIAMLCGQWVESRGMGDFAAGFRRAFVDADLPCPRDLLFNALEGESLKELAHVALTTPEPPTAIFAEDWRVCQAVLAAANELNLRIPQHLSIISCGQNALRIDLPVAITAISLDNEGIGQYVGRVLMQILESGQVPTEPIWLSGTIVERDSVRQIS